MKFGKPQLTFVKTLVQDYLGKNIPIFLDVKITYRCNCKCSFCNLWKRKSLDELTLEEHKNLLDQAKELGVCLVSYEGGEPLLREDLPEILLYAKRKGMIVHLNTNGLLLSEKAGSILPYLDEISVSLDYFDKKKHESQRGVSGLYDKALNGIKKVKDRVSVTISATITRDTTKHDILMLSNLCKKLNVSISFQPAFFFSGTTDLTVAANKTIEMFEFIEYLKEMGYPIYNLRSFLDLLKGKIVIPCRAGDTCIFVHPDGKVSFPCNQWEGRENFVGSVRERSLREIWESSIVEKLREKARECNSCYFGCTVYLSLATTKSSCWVDYLKSYVQTLR
jgi:MoaA/NifB/PqqE/SkfB family radical SAM enzyme